MHNGHRLGTSFASKDPAHIRRWVAAQRAGQLRAIKCEAIARHSGEKCCRLPVRGSKFCYSHRRGQDTIDTDLAKIERNQKVLASSSRGVARRRAEKSMARIRRWEIWRLWRDVDPRVPDLSFLALSPADEEEVWLWLRANHNICPDRPLPGGDRRPTARCRERIRVAVWRMLSMGDLATAEIVQKAHARVKVAVADDLKFWALLDNPNAERKTRYRRRRLR